VLLGTALLLICDIQLAARASVYKVGSIFLTCTSCGLLKREREGGGGGSGDTTLVGGGWKHYFLFEGS
jgi:hypothetical protein